MKMCVFSMSGYLLLVLGRSIPLSPIFKPIRDLQTTMNGTEKKVSHWTHFRVGISSRTYAELGKVLSVIYAHM